MADMPDKTNEAFDPKEFLAKVGEGKTILEFRKGQVVFAQGDAADTIYYIQRGRVKVVVISEQGKEAVVGILEPGQFFGEGCMNGHALRIATTTTMEGCLITAITKAAMVAALHNQPKFSELFMAYLLTRNSRIEEDLIDQLFNSSEKRLARLLLLLANFGKEGSPQPISPNISQETLAEMIGPRQLLHEQVPQARLHQLQRKDRGQQLFADRGLVRQTRDQARAVNVGRIHFNNAAPTDDISPLGPKPTKQPSPLSAAERTQGR